MIKPSDFRIYFEPSQSVIHHSRNFRIRKSFEALPVLKQNYVRKLQNEKLVKNLDPFHSVLLQQYGSMQCTQQKQQLSDREPRINEDNHRALKSVTVQSVNSYDVKMAMEQCMKQIERTLVVIPKEQNRSLPQIDQKESSRQKAKQYAESEQRKAIGKNMSGRVLVKHFDLENGRFCCLLQKKKVKVTAKRWCIGYRKYGQSRFVRLGGQNDQKKCEVASLTKIMTFFTAVEYLERRGIRSEMMMVRIPGVAEEMEGTSAGLRKGELLSMIDLLYGLMLPSGNDAAVVISLVIGLLVHCEVKDIEQFKKLQELVELDLLCEMMVSRKEMKLLFVRRMNENCQILQLKNTSFANVSGLNDKSNYSTAEDIMLLSERSLQFKIFREVVRTRVYERSGYKWKNTNALLKTGWKGLKTGVTKNAGPCFCGYFSCPQGEVLIVLLRCAGMEERWTDSDQLLNLILK